MLSYIHLVITLASIRDSATCTDNMLWLIQLVSQYKQHPKTKTCQTTLFIIG